MARPKVLVEIDKFNEKTGHKHTGGVGDAPPIPSSGIADGAITDDKLGNITLDQSQVPTISTGKLRQILNWFANRLTAITGKENWWEPPTKSLEQLNNENGIIVDSVTGKEYRFGMEDGIVFLEEVEK